MAADTPVFYQGPYTRINIRIPPLDVEKTVRCVCLESDVCLTYHEMEEDQICALST